MQITRRRHAAESFHDRFPLRTKPLNLLLAEILKIGAVTFGILFKFCHQDLVHTLMLGHIVLCGPRISASHRLTHGTSSFASINFMSVIKIVPLSYTALLFKIWLTPSHSRVWPFQQQLSCFLLYQSPEREKKNTLHIEAPREDPVQLHDRPSFGR